MGKWEEIEINKLLEKTKTENPKTNPNAEFVYIDISSIDREIKKVVDPKLLIGSEAPSRARKSVASGDVLFATTRPNLQNIAIVEDNTKKQIASTGFCVLRGKKDLIENRFLFNYLLTNEVQELIAPLIRGAQYPAISDKDLKSIKIPLPPLPEQQRIVAKLDGLFAKIDQAISVLEANLQHTQALMGSVLDEEFGKLKDKFKNLALEEVLKIKSGDFLSSKKMSNTDEYNVYGGNGINGTHNLFNLEGENIIIGRVGAKCGNVRLVNESIWVTDNAFYVSEIKKDITKEFLLEILRLLKLGDTANQAAQPVISFKGIRNLVMPIPDRKSQKVFCLKSQKLRKEKNKLIETQTQKLNHLKALKSSLLDQAFKGEL